MTSRQRRPELDLADVRGDDVADDGGDDRAGRLRGSHRAEPSGSSSEDVRHVGQRFDVVDEGRVRATARAGAWCRFPSQLGSGGEQAVFVGWEPARQRRLALDHFEHRLFLTEEVLVGSGDDRHLAVGADPFRLELLHGAGDGVELALEAAFEADEDLDGSDGEGGDDDPFDELVGVGSEQGAVLERARFALGAVAHHEAAGPDLGGDACPLSASRKSTSSPATEPGGEHGVDRRRWTDPLGAFDPQPTDVRGQVGVERGHRIDWEEECGHRNPHQTQAPAPRQAPASEGQRLCLPRPPAGSRRRSARSPLPIDSTAMPFGAASVTREPVIRCCRSAVRFGVAADRPRARSRQPPAPATGIDGLRRNAGVGTRSGERGSARAHGRCCAPTGITYATRLGARLSCAFWDSLGVIESRPDPSGSINLCGLGPVSNCDDWHAADSASRGRGCGSRLGG